VVSFTFGCPTVTVIERLRRAGIRVWVTVTDVEEATTAAGRGVDALVVQGAQAGGHRGSFDDDDDEPSPLRDLLVAVHGALPAVPIVATGGLMTGGDIADVLAAGAAAAQFGTAFLRCPEAGTSEVHRRALRGATGTVLTRAFTGRLARGIANAWTEGVGRDAPSAYPDVHHITAGLRAHGRVVGDPDLVNLWAGTGHRHSRDLSAGDLVAALAAELRAAT
jgi:nitronate monooxygenase